MANEKHALIDADHFRAVQDEIDEYRVAGPAIKLIAAERREQARKGWTAEHDDVHRDGELVVAATCYSLVPFCSEHGCDAAITPESWPWDADSWKPSPGDPIRDLVKAAALIAAEIDRRLRIAASAIAPDADAASPTPSVVIEAADVEPLTYDDVRRDEIRTHNAWVEGVKKDVEFEPLRNFLDLLKEDED